MLSSQWGPNIVKVFPDPVCPYAKMVELKPESTSFMLSRKGKLEHLKKLTSAKFKNLGLGSILIENSIKLRLYHMLSICYPNTLQTRIFTVWIIDNFIFMQFILQEGSNPDANLYWFISLFWFISWDWAVSLHAHVVVSVSSEADRADAVSHLAIAALGARLSIVIHNITFWK